MEYDFSDEVMVYIDGKIGDVEDLKKGLFVKLILDRNDEVVFVKAENTDDDEFKGEISQIVLGKGAQFTFKTGSKEKTFKIDSDTEIEKDGKEIFINDLEIGWTVSVDVKKGVALKITVLEDEDEDNKAEKVKYKGTVRRVDADDATISIRGEKGNIYTFDVDEDAEITLDGASADLEDLKRGVEVEVVVIDDIAVKITAESSEEEFTGEIVAITLVGQDTVIIETDDDSEYVFDVTEDTIIRLNGKSADLDDLAKGDWVEIIARKGGALKIYAERDEK